MLRISFVEELSGGRVGFNETREMKQCPCIGEKISIYPGTEATVRSVHWVLFPGDYEVRVAFRQHRGGHTVRRAVNDCGV